MNMLTPIPMISERAAGEIRTAILDGSLPPGSPIHQERFAARLGISREPIRKALILLEQEGLVNIVGRSAVVVSVDQEFLDDIYGFREVLEGYVAARIAARTDFDPTALREILAAGRQSVESGSVERLIELDQAFHLELYRACENRVVMKVMEREWSHIYRAMMMDLSMDSFREQSWNEHADILDAITRREVSRARTLASEHIRAALDRKEARLKARKMSL